MLKILTIVGTRPEAIKLAPVILELKKNKDIDSRVCLTAQHRQMLDQVLHIFDIVPDIDLNLMKPDQSLSEITSRILKEIDRVYIQESPDLVLIQGDTTTVMAASLSAFYRNIKIGHVEAGLRSNNIYSPFPEEMNRRIAGLLADFHFAPTYRAVQSLQREGVPKNKIFLTGNSVIDALKLIASKPIPEMSRSVLEAARKTVNGGKVDIILVTAHRRENFGKPFENICRGLKHIVQRNQNVVIIFPVHLNPHIQEPANRILGGQDRVILIKPLGYDSLVHLMKESYIILTDSGGIQEEAPSFGKPVLVMRTETERPEGIQAGSAKLVGPIEDKIITETELLLKSRTAYDEMAKINNPYGDGFTAGRIVNVLRTLI